MTRKSRRPKAIIMRSRSKQASECKNKRLPPHAASLSTHRPGLGCPRLCVLCMCVVNVKRRSKPTKHRTRNISRTLDVEDGDGLGRFPRVELLVAKLRREDVVPVWAFEKKWLSNRKRACVHLIRHPSPRPAARHAPHKLVCAAACRPQPRLLHLARALKVHRCDA